MVDALRMAWFRRRSAAGLVVHSDRSSQYCGHLFQSALKAYGMKRSMSRKGDCWDNAKTLRFSVGASTVPIGTEQRPDWRQNFMTLSDRAIEQVSFGIASNTSPSVYTTNWSNLGKKNNDLVIAKAGGIGLGGFGNDLLVGGRAAEV